MKALPAASGGAISMVADEQKLCREMLTPSPRGEDLAWVKRLLADRSVPVAKRIRQPVMSSAIAHASRRLYATGRWQTASMLWPSGSRMNAP